MAFSSLAVSDRIGFPGTDTSRLWLKSAFASNSQQTM
jgi:hypothetical protein